MELNNYEIFCPLYSLLDKMVIFQVPVLLSCNLGGCILYIFKICLLQPFQQGMSALILWW
jgi:hypothetical protein